MEGNLKKLFAALQANLRPIGYTLEESAFDRVANLLNTRTNKFQKKVKEEKNEKRREKKKTESWIKIALHPEFSRTPYDIVAEMSQKENELRRENNDPQDAQAKQAEQLCEALKEVHQKDTQAETSQTSVTNNNWEAPVAHPVSSTCCDFYNVYFPTNYNILSLKVVYTSK